MRISRISEPGSVGPVETARRGGGITKPVMGVSAGIDSEATFTDVVKSVVESTNADQTRSDTAMRDLMNGNIDNIHDVVLSVAKADLSFRFLMEVRNKVTEAYQEISRMQL